jgi:CheY-like chemotaxis protein
MTERPRLMVVDDDIDIRDSLADVLGDEGYDVTVAKDGHDALSKLKSGPLPGLILLDWMMPQCDGATFRAQQKLDPTIADVPVVLLTADAHTQRKMAELDAVAYLTKPVDLARLIAVLQQHWRASTP